MFMCVVHQKSVINLDLTWKKSFLIYCKKFYTTGLRIEVFERFFISFDLPNGLEMMNARSNDDDPGTIKHFHLCKVVFTRAGRL